MMPTPDARPVGETALAEGEARTRLETAFDACLEAWARQHGGMDDGNEEAEDFEDALNAYREAVAAEARAALLAGAPAVWVTTDADGLSGSRVFATEQFADPDGTFWPDEDCAFLDTALTPPGTSVRYRLVPDPEGPHA